MSFRGFHEPVVRTTERMMLGFQYCLGALVMQCVVRSNQWALPFLLYNVTKFPKSQASFNRMHLVSLSQVKFVDFVVFHFMLLNLNPMSSLKRISCSMFEAKHMPYMVQVPTSMLSVACRFLIGSIVFPVSVNSFLKYHVCMAMNNTVKVTSLDFVG